MTVQTIPAEPPPTGAQYTWEEAVDWLRRQPEHEELVRACYFDDPLLGAAERFADSAEWREVSSWLPRRGGRALDIGAGRGIGSFALARAGWRVDAVEPDGSDLVGAGAIRRLAEESGLRIDVTQGSGESVPFDDRTFDLAYGRQVLHHAADLPRMCREIARVLKPGGRFVATREHVISHPEDLAVFLEEHPLHGLYGGEHAYLFNEYTTAIRDAAMRCVRVFGPFDSVVNYFPMTHREWCIQCRRPVGRVVGTHLARLLADDRHMLGRWLLRRSAARLSRASNYQGRLYSFVAEKVS